MQRLVELARNHGLAIICDEIQMGLRRTGPMFMCLAQGWEPDLLVLGKSLGGGIVPIAAVIGSHEWIDAIPPGIESETFAAYPLACRIAQETLEILEQGNLAGEIERKGELFRTLLRTSLPQNIVIHGVGLATCVSLENLPNQGVSAAVDLVRRLAKQGVLVHLTGPKRNRIATIPSLLIGQASIELAAKEIIKAFEAVG
jgi:acetylornithine/succinyldiaminopimelate/putrescine aminotransferase